MYHWLKFSFKSVSFSRGYVGKEGGCFYPNHAAQCTTAIVLLFNFCLA